MRGGEHACGYPRFEGAHTLRALRLSSKDRVSQCIRYSSKRPRMCVIFYTILLAVVIFFAVLGGVGRHTSS